MSRDKVLTVLREKSVLHAEPGKPFILKSGAESMHYVDVRLTALSWRGMSLLRDQLVNRIYDMGIQTTHVAGVVVGGCPLATAVSLTAGMDVLYVRPEPKAHGTGKLIEGPFKGGESVVLLEDVITSGGSTLKAIAALRDAGFKVSGVVAVLDREQGGLDVIKNECPVSALFTLKELLAT